MKTCTHSRRWIAGALIAGAILLGTALSERPAPAQALSGLDLYRTNCDGCHDLYDPEDPKRTRAQWDTILTRMVKERGATLNAQEFKAVLNYLDSFNREPRQIQWVETPAKSRKAVFPAASVGKLPAEWVDLTVGGDEEIPWAVEVDPKTQSGYVAPLKTAGENQYPVLIDNTGIVKDGGATARLQIVSGKGALGAGVVFGFRSPQSYYGVRISPTDVLLYEVQNGQRALLAPRASMPLPTKQWHTVSVQLAGKEVKVSVDNKPLPGLTRTLASYRGGRMGIHTQADTVALFDQWEVVAK